VGQSEVQPISRMLVDLISSTLVMAGHLGVFVAVMSFGRHVYLDSQGLLPARAAKPRRARLRARSSPAEKTGTRRKATVATESESPPEQPEVNRPEPSPEVAPPVLRLGAAADEAEEDGSEGEDLAESSSGERLSKTERRRLKKLKRQEQLRRAA
jgi:hypothetical protein